MGRPEDLFRRYGAFLLAGLLIGGGLAALGLVGLNMGPDLLRSLRGQSRISPLVPRLDEPAGDFDLETLSGAHIHLADLRGQPVLINFWATWCGPCREEMPLIEGYYRRNNSSLRVLAINFDEPVEDVQAFIAENGFTFDVLLDPDTRVADLYRVRGLPTTIFIDPEGVIRYRHIGPLSEKQLVSYLQEIGAGG